MYWQGIQIESNRSYVCKARNAASGFTLHPSKIFLWTQCLPVTIYTKDSDSWLCSFTKICNAYFAGESGLGKSTMINSLFLSELYNAGYPGPSLRTQKTVQVIPSNNFYCPHYLWATTSTEFRCCTETNAARHFWCMMHLVAFIDWCITGVQIKESFNNDTTVHLWSWSWSWQWVWAPWSRFPRSCLPICILNKTIQ